MTLTMEYEIIHPLPVSRQKDTNETRGWLKTLWLNGRYLVIFLTPLLLCPIPIAVPTPIGFTAFSIMLMAVFWTTECIPLAATALFPLVLFPFFGVLESKVVCIQYLKDINVLFIAGLMVAIAVEHWNLHKRIALRILLLVGSKPRWLMFGLMITTAFLSMWISNTASTAMMVPIAQAVLQQLKQDEEETDVDFNENEDADIDNKEDVGDAIKMDEFTANGQLEQNKQCEGDDDIKPKYQAKPTADLTQFDYLCKGIILCVPYAANIGGTATLTGTGPNLVLSGQAESLYGREAGINFGTYMMYAFPGMIVCLFLAWGWLQIYFIDRWRFFGKSRNNVTQTDRAAKYIQKSYNELGSMSFAEIAVSIHLVVLILLWLTRDPKFVPGWASFFRSGYISDGTSGMLIALLLFLIPSKPPQFLCGFGKQSEEQDARIPALLDWDVVQHKMAWNVVILMGGGFAMAEACKVSGLSAWLGNQFLVLSDISPEAIAFIVSIIVAIFTEITSNTSTAIIFLPILAELGSSLGVNPLFLMISASIACSFAFMLPVATPPNAIAFAYGHVTVLDMMKAGCMLNLLCILVSNLSLNTLGVAIFDVKTYPHWANVKSTVMPEVFDTVLNNCTAL